jgi:hypothetical protein
MMGLKHMSNDKYSTETLSEVAAEFDLAVNAERNFVLTYIRLGATGAKGIRQLPRRQGADVSLLTQVTIY